MRRSGWSHRGLRPSRQHGELLGEFHSRAHLDRRRLYGGVRGNGVAFRGPILSGVAQVAQMALMTVTADSAGGSIV